MGVYLDGNYHRVFVNNFIKNGDNAFFIKRRPYFDSDSWCKWSFNYWDDLGSSNYKLINGRIFLFSGLFRDYFFPWIQYDRHPAKEPTSIIVSMVQTGGYISIQKVTGGEIVDITGVNISYMADNGAIAGYGTYNDIDSDGMVSGGDTISPPVGLKTGGYTVIMTYYDDIIGNCKFTVP